MYCDYFGFKQEPFTIAPDPSFLYPSAKHRQALAHLKYGLDREGGFILLTGEVGTGKTTLTRLLLEQIPAAFRVAYVLNAKLDTEDVLASICDELHIEMPAESSRSPKSYIDAINKNLLETHAQGFKTLVVLEEAQNLGEEVLEMLRLLTNLETNTSKLLHILLVGQPELLDLIGQPQLRQLNQRVISRFHIQPLDRSETESYLNHRMRKAGCGRALFDRSAIDCLHRLSGGIPRKLNLLAERALLGAYSLDKEKVSRSHVLQANIEVFGEQSVSKNHLQRAWVFVSVIAVVALVLFLNRSAIEEYWQSGLYPESRLSDDQIEDVVIRQALDVAIAVADSTQGGELGLAEKVIQVAENTQTIQEGYLPAAESSKPLVGVSSELLALWQIEADVPDIASLCIEAASNNLRCEEFEPFGIEDILAINRPMLLELSNTDGTESSEFSSRYYLLESVDNSTFYLSGRSGSGDGQEFLFEGEQLERLISGSAHFLWKPPLGFQEFLVEGDSNWAVLNWLQPRLADIDPELPQLITGGRYSQPIRDAVFEFQSRHGLKTDGVLGQRTLMKFNQIDNSVPLLVRENQ